MKMKWMVRVFLMVPALMSVFGCSGGNLTTGADSSDPLDSKVKASVTLSGSTLIVVPPVDGKFLVNVVKNGSPAVVSVDDVVAVAWHGEKAGWPPRSGSRAGFNKQSVSLAIPAGEKEGLIAFITKDGQTLWMNTDFVDPHGVTVDTRKGLILLHG